MFDKLMPNGGICQLGEVSLQPEIRTLPSGKRFVRAHVLLMCLGFELLFFVLVLFFVLIVDVLVDMLVFLVGSRIVGVFVFVILVFGFDILVFGFAFFVLILVFFSNYSIPYRGIEDK